MSSTDQLPDDPTETDKSVTIRLTRDSLILVAAVGFLGVAILLAVLFGGQPAPSPSTATEIALRPTIDTTDTTQAATPTGAEPGLDIASPIAEARPTSLPEPPPTIVAAVASFTPLAPTAPVTGEPAYPGPGAEALTPTAPSGTASAPVFAPTVVIPTAQPPIATIAPAPTSLPLPTAPPVPTLAPITAAPVTFPTVEQPVATRQPAPAATARPTVAPITQLRGTVYWRAGDSPYTVSRDLLVMAGAALIIEPGVEVRIAPGISILVDGKLYALGKPGQSVRFVGTSPQRWESIIGRAGSELVFEQAEVRGGGAGGTTIASEGGALALRGARISDNGGHIDSRQSTLEVRDTEISGNDMPYGAALQASFGGGSASIRNTRIGGNRMSSGAPQILIENMSDFESLAVDIQGNLLIGQDGPNLTLTTNTTPISGSIACNALLNGANGLSLRSETDQTPGFPLSIHDNAIDDHIPPIIPVYLKYGIGRGATSEVQLDMRNNWWGSDLGPYEPDRWADGRGDSVGENISFDPWLKSWPACVPHP